MTKLLHDEYIYSINIFNYEYYEIIKISRETSSYFSPMNALFNAQV